MHINAPRDQPGASPLLLRPCRRKSPARGPRRARGDSAAALGFAAIPAKQRAPRVSHWQPVGAEGRKHWAEEDCEDWGSPVTPQCRAGARAAPGGAAAPDGALGLPPAVPWLPPAPGHPGAPGRRRGAAQKLLPSRDRVFAAILTRPEQAHRREAAGDPPPLRGAAREGHRGGQGCIRTARGMLPSLPADFPDTTPGPSPLLTDQAKNRNKPQTKPNQKTPCNFLFQVERRHTDTLSEITRLCSYKPSAGHQSQTSTLSTAPTTPTGGSLDFNQKFIRMVFFLGYILSHCFSMNHSVSE